MNFLDQLEATRKMFKAGYQTIDPSKIVDSNEFRFQFVNNNDKSNDRNNLNIKDPFSKGGGRKKASKGVHKSSIRELMANE
jgi:hypothetical protein